MRKLTIERMSSYVEALTKLDVYVEDVTAGEFAIGEVRCRKLGNLANGESKTFEIGEHKVKVFLIVNDMKADGKLTFYDLQEGMNDISIYGQFALNPSGGIAFHLVDNPGKEDGQQKKKRRIKNIIRLPFQAIALILQTYFIVETIRLYLYGYVMYEGEPIEDSWFAMLFTLLVVAVCETISFVETLLFVKAKKSDYSKFYLILFIINALCFLTMAYYSVIGTTICMVCYGILFIVRIVNLVLNVVDVFKKS